MAAAVVIVLAIVPYRIAYCLRSLTEQDITFPEHCHGSRSRHFANDSIQAIS
jgi:hypothetical protein